MRSVRLLCFCLFAFCLSFAWAQELVQGAENFGPFYPAVFAGDLRELAVEPAWQMGDPIKEIPRMRHSELSDFETQRTFARDPLLARQERLGQARALGSIGLNFAGQAFTGSNPPDTVGDVGLNYYIQAVNSLQGAIITVYNKSDGSVAAGPIRMSALGIGNCGTGKGDPVVLYDVLAQRWLISEFSTQGNQLCVYISRTSNPIAGGWYNYAFSAPFFPDYPKYGVWNDAYYVTTNEDDGGAIYALNRASMLIGGAASMQRFVVGKLAGFVFNTLTPVDPDSELAPPSNEPFPILRHVDDEAHEPGSNDSSQDFLELYRLQINWSNAALSSLSGPVPLAIAEFDSSLCGLTSFSCFGQPNSSVKLDPLREVLMYRLAYYNFGSHQAIVGNMVTDTNGEDHGGIRWFELRKYGNATWSLFQEGTFAPDADNRWMGSIAMDQSGNIALGYNLSSSSTAPSLRITGREAIDPVGVLAQGELVLAAGTSANRSSRYGDYAAMSLDPSDHCTFWFTGEYNSGADWSTRIGNFRFSHCGCVQSPATGLNVVVNGENRLDLSWTAPAANLTYNLYRTRGDCESAFQLLQAGLVGTSFSDTSVSGGSQYAYKLLAVNAASHCLSDFSNCAVATATGSCFLAPQFNGIAAAENQQNLSCGIALSWEAGSSLCNSELVYNIYRTEVGAFNPAPENLLVSCLSETSYLDQELLPETLYAYIVRAEDPLSLGTGPCGGAEDANNAVLSAIPSSVPFQLFEDELESGTNQWTQTTGSSDSGTLPWALTTAQSHSASHSFFVPNPAKTSDQRLQLASELLLSGNLKELTFWHRYGFEKNWDGGVLEYSTDAGETWQDILESDGKLVPENPGRIRLNGYNDLLKDSVNPLAGRVCWTGSNLSWQQVRIDLSDFPQQLTLFRWRVGSDAQGSGAGWYVDDIVITQYPPCFPVTCKEDRYSHWPEHSILEWVNCINLEFTATRAHFRGK